MPGHPAFPALIAIALLLSSCAVLRSTEQPIPTRWHTDGASSETLVVFLRGAGGRADQVERAGVIELLAESDLDWHAVSVDAHFGYYRERSIIDRLNEDVLAEARARGYQQIWLAGPSLGGFGSLLYWCRTQHHDIAGIIALAPYLGGSGILQEIEAAGGLAGWHPDGNGEEHEVALWQCIQNGFPDELPVWLAYGTGDRMARGNRILAEVLPEDRELTMEGGHRWTVWTQLLETIFESISSEAP